MPLKKNIYLTGFMGTGKTTAGKIAALPMGIPCLDTDFLVEKKFKSTISRIFLKKGEATFRTAESEVIRQTLHFPPHVITLGGGAVLSAANRDVFRQGIWINLNADTAIILKRLEGKKNRPLMGKKATRERVEELLKPRLPFYRMAPHQVESGMFSPMAVAGNILRIVGVKS